MSDALDVTKVIADLHSGIPARVASALSALERASLRLPVTPVPMPRVDVLDSFGDRPPEEIVVSFSAVALGYPLFDPPADISDRMEAALEASLRFGPGQPAYDLARFVRASDNAPAAVDLLMRLMVAADIEDQSGLDTISQIVDVLLDATATHDAAVRGLEHWAFIGRYESVIAGLRTALAPSEREKIDRVGT